MVVKGRHLKDASARLTAAFRQFENRNLDHHRYSLEDEHTADKWEQKFLLGQNRDRPERTADRQTADIAHKHLGGWRVVPQKSETGADHRAAKYRQLRCLGPMGQIQI